MDEQATLVTLASPLQTLSRPHRPSLLIRAVAASDPPGETFDGVVDHNLYIRP